MFYLCAKCGRIVKAGSGRPVAGPEKPNPNP